MRPTTGSLETDLLKKVNILHRKFKSKKQIRYNSYKYFSEILHEFESNNNIPLQQNLETSLTYDREHLYKIHDSTQSLPASPIPRDILCFLPSKMLLMHINSLFRMTKFSWAVSVYTTKKYN